MENVHLIKNEDYLKFVLAGKARFTLVGSQNRFTYYVMQPKFEGKPSLTHRFVKVSDASRGNDYTYIGFLKLVNGQWQYRFGAPNVRTPSFNPQSLEVIAFRFVFERAVFGIFDPRLEMWNEGKCACCGRPLTTPESIVKGWGRSCLNKLKIKELASETQEEFLAR